MVVNAAIITIKPGAVCHGMIKLYCKKKTVNSNGNENSNQNKWNMHIKYIFEKSDGYMIFSAKMCSG